MHPVAAVTRWLCGEPDQGGEQSKGGGQQEEEERRGVRGGGGCGGHAEGTGRTEIMF